MDNGSFLVVSDQIEHESLEERVTLGQDGEAARQRTVLEVEGLTLAEADRVALSDKQEMRGPRRPDRARRIAGVLVDAVVEEGRTGAIDQLWREEGHVVGVGVVGEPHLVERALGIEEVEAMAPTREVVVENIRVP